MEYDYAKTEYDIEQLNEFCRIYDYEISALDLTVNYVKRKVLTDFKPDFQKFFEEEALCIEEIYVNEKDEVIESKANPKDVKKFYSNINTIKHKALLNAFDLAHAQTEEDYICAAYNIGLYMGLLGNHETIKQKCSKAGKASYKAYKSTKQKVFEYAQNLLNKSKTKYTANALADKITNAYLLGNIPEIKFDAENPKPTIYKWLKNEFPYFTNNEKKI